MGRTKILIVVNYILEGGLTHVLLDVLKALTAGYDVTVLTIFDLYTEYVKEVKVLAKYDTLDCWRHRISNNVLLSLYSRLMDNRAFQVFLYNYYVSHHRFDIEVAFAEDWAINVVAKSKSKSRKYAWIHTDFLCDEVNDRETLISNTKLMLREFDKVIFVSESLRRKFATLLSLSKTISIPNAVDIDAIHQKAQSSCDIMMNQDVLNLIFVGRLNHEKGVEILIDSLICLPQEYAKKCYLYIIGDGCQRTYLENKVQENNLKNVFLLGSKQNPFPYVKQASYLILRSKYEGFGLVLIEAMALGVPCIATKTVGATEVLDNGKYGIMIDYNKESISNVIKECILYPEKRIVYQSLQKKKLQAYTMDKYIEQLNTLFQ